MTARFTVTVRQVRDDGSEAPLAGELAAALAGPAEQFAGLAARAAGEAGYLDPGEREKVTGDEGRELQRRLLQATFDIDAAREERAAGVTSAAGIGHGIVENGHGRGVTSVFGRPSTWPAAASGRPRRSSSPVPASRSAARSSPASPRTSRPGRTTSASSVPATRRKKSSRAVT